MLVLDGRYAMALGHGAGVSSPPIAARMIATAGTKYSMIDPDTWHDVRPLDGPAITPLAQRGIAAPETSHDAPREALRKRADTGG